MFITVLVFFNVCLALALYKVTKVNRKLEKIEQAAMVSFNNPIGETSPEEFDHLMLYILDTIHA